MADPDPVKPNPPEPAPAPRSPGAPQSVRKEDGQDPAERRGTASDFRVRPAAPPELDESGGH